jgi:hypothetical protein
MRTVIEILVEKCGLLEIQWVVGNSGGFAPPPEKVNKLPATE